MNPEKQARIRQTLKSLAEAQAATIALMEEALALMTEELALDPITFWKSRDSPFVVLSTATKSDLFDTEMLTVTFQRKPCFLGNTLPFRFFVRLARRPNTYVTYEDLLEDVWEGVRTDDAIRSVVKTLRSKLREARIVIDGGLIAFDGNGQLQVAVYFGRPANAKAARLCSTAFKGSLNGHDRSPFIIDCSNEGIGNMKSVVIVIQLNRLPRHRASKPGKPAGPKMHKCYGKETSSVSH